MQRSVTSRLAALLGALALAGGVADSGSRLEAADAPEPDRAAPVPVLPGDRVPAPGEDGWDTEAFTEAAEIQLKKLGALILESADADRGAGAPPSLAPLADPQVACGALRPASIREVPREGGRFIVRREGAGEGVSIALPRPAGDDPADTGLEALARQLAELGAPYAGDPGARFKFKLFDVDSSGAPVVATRQFFSLSGRTASGFREENAEWRIEWVVPAGGAGPPRIRRLEPLAWEQVEVPADGGSEPLPLLVDRTGAVAGGDPAFRDHYRLGNAHWRARIELFNRFFKFGHNGIAVADVDGDGREDVYSCQTGGLPNRLFLHQPDGTVRDGAAAAGVDFLDSTRSALFADFDNDGDPDLALALAEGVLILENDGTGRFAPRVRFPSVSNGFSLAAADFDLDGDLDLYVCRYYAGRTDGASLPVPAPQFDANNGGPNFLVRNDGRNAAGDWLDFSDVTAESGLDENNRRFSFAAVWDDVDRDGDPDLYVANDFGRNNLYLNEGSRGQKPRFRDVAAEAGMDDGAFGMSAATGDFDRDGRLDLHVGNMFSAAGSRVTAQSRFMPEQPAEVRRKFRHLARGNSLFRAVESGDGRPRFEDVSEAMGITLGRWAWGSIFADLDHDGWEDIVVANGFVTGSVPDDL